MGTLCKVLKTHLQKYHNDIKGNLRTLCFDYWKQQSTQGLRWLMCCTFLLKSTRAPSLCCSETANSIDSMLPHRIDSKSKWANAVLILSMLANSFSSWVFIYFAIGQSRRKEFYNGFYLRVFISEEFVSDTMEKMPWAPTYRRKKQYNLCHKPYFSSSKMIWHIYIWRSVVNKTLFIFESTWNWKSWCLSYENVLLDHILNIRALNN